ncbi:uncharacterized protein LOC108100573 [Drosophila ficusphila]|uniref:uncharacterized protein LOC108100573 n=1 Tax=Drosophila ficusphila TaxID=30025 RepID=UPI0007E60BE2|nr:uncharacterized protein LOC108100573 [Drosophila ficusphila]
MGKRVEKRRGNLGRCGWLLVLPLATILSLSASAQTVTSPSISKDDTLGDAAVPSQSVAKILEDDRTISAVQDWSLLCKELCGAGLGVAKTPDGAKSTILRPEFDVAKCRQLCGLPRGGVGDLVCSSFCGQRGRSLPGCSPCQQEVRRTQEEEKEKDMEKQKDIIIHNERMEEASGVPAHGPGSLQRSVESSSATPIVAGSDADPTTDSPDWDEVCKVLCKTGDGGSLCNCDLSPFFS